MPTVDQSPLSAAPLFVHVWIEPSAATAGQSERPSPFASANRVCVPGAPSAGA